MKKLILILCIVVIAKNIKAQTGFACFSATNNILGTPGGTGLISGNFNSNINKDIAYSFTGATTLLVLSGNGNGTFGAAINYNTSFTAAQGMKTIIKSNFDNDAFDDLTVIANTINSSINIFYGNGSGMNTASSYTTSVAGPKNDIHAADLNGDSNPDLIVSNTSANKYTVMTYTGTRNFNAGVDYSLSFTPNKIKSGLINNDAFPDLVISSANSGSIAVCLGSSTGTFAPAVNYTVAFGSTPTDLEVVDLNGDGKGEIVIVTAAQRHIYSNNGFGVLTTLSTPTLGNTFNATTIADIDADGKKDFIVSDLVGPGSGGIQVMLNNASGDLINSLIYSASTIAPPIDVIADDFDNDGKPDIITLNNNGSVSILMNKPRPTLNVTPNNSFICYGNSASINVSGASTYTWSTGSNGTNISPSPLTNTIYVVTGTQYGCSSAATQVTVNVGNQLFSPINGGGTFCSGTANALSVNASGGSTPYYYSWSPPTGLSSANTQSTNATLNATNTYTHTLTDVNGCVSTNTVMLTIIPSPTVSISVSSMSVCASNTVTLTGNGANSYQWIPGNWSGSAYTYTPNTTQNYYAIGTDANGCQALSNTITVSANPNPTLTLNPIPSTICSGATGTISTSGAATYTLNTGLTGGNFNITPTVTTNYTVTGTSALGCVSSNFVTMAVNPTPTITITASSPTACAASVSTFTANGASTYTWSTGSNSLSISVTPTVTSTYTVDGTNTFGCVSTKTINLLVSNSTNVGGNVTTGASIPVAGLVTLFRYEPVLTKFDSITSIAIGAGGAYTFTNAINSNTYMVKAIPTTNTLQATYGNSSISWMNGTQYIHGCATAGTMNINVISLTPITPGSGILSGTIEQGPGYGMRMSSEAKPLGTPIKGIIVKGGKNPGGNIVAQTTTDAAGNYTLSGLPNNGDNYFILVDIAGLDTNLTYHRVLTASNSSYTNLNFTVDSIRINPISNTSVGLNESSVNQNSISIFPNPTSSILNINFSLTNTSDVSIEVFDLLGKSVKTIVDVKNQTANNYQASASVEDLSAGIYIIKTIINKKQHTFKLTVN